MASISKKIIVFCVGAILCSFLVSTIAKDIPRMEMEKKEEHEFEAQDDDYIGYGAIHHNYERPHPIGDEPPANKYTRGCEREAHCRQG
ncbi:unnamed protein product [Camellia sinensis]